MNVVDVETPQKTKNYAKNVNKMAPKKETKSINVYIKDYKDLNKIRLRMSNIDPLGRIVTFGEVIHSLLCDQREVLDR